MAYVEAIAALAIVLWLNYVRLCWKHRADRRRREITHSITLLEVLDFGPALLPCPIIPSLAGPDPFRYCASAPRKGLGVSSSVVV